MKNVLQKSLAWLTVVALLLTVLPVVALEKLAAPTALSDNITPTTITLDAVEGCEYRCGEGEWQASTLFDKLVADTEYSFYQRYVDDEESTSDAALIRTAVKYPSPSAPDAPAVASFTDTTVTLTATDGYEYKMDDGAWTTNNVFTDLAPHSEHTFYQRIAETDTAYASDASEGTTQTTKYVAPDAPDAPEIEDNGATFVTLVATPGMEYSYDLIHWQTNATFDGLTPNTTYRFYRRFAETDDTCVGNTSAPSIFKTPRSVNNNTPDAPQLDTATINTILLVVVEGCEYKLGDGEWQASPLFEGLNPNTEYTFYQRYARADTVEHSNTSAAQKIKTDKITPEAPESAPTVDSFTDTTVTLVATDGYEYRMDDGEWQVSSEFTGLDPHSEHIFYQRIAETETTNASDASKGTTQTTDKSATTAPAAPTVDSYTDTTVTLVATDGYEYKMNDGEWQTSNVFTGLSQHTAYTFYQRVAENETVYASDASEGTTQNTDFSTPPAPVCYDELCATSDMIVLVEIEGCEYRMDDGDWQTSPVFNGLSFGEEHTFTQRYAASGDYPAGPISDPAIIKVKTPSATPTAPVAEAIGFDFITLVNTDGYEYKMNDGEWQDSPRFENLDMKTEYTFYQRVKGTELVCRSLSSPAATIVTTKPSVDAPVAPVIAGTSDDGRMVTLVLVTGCEYKLDDGEWQESNVFTNVIPGVQHYFYQRYKETDISDYSPDSEQTDYYYEKRPYEPAPGMPTIVRIDAPTDSILVSVLLETVENCEYSMDGIAWQTSPFFDSIFFGDTCYFYMRYAETEFYSSSAPGVPLVIELNKHSVATPEKPTIAYVTANTVVLNVVSGYEYSRDGINWQTSPEFSGLTPGQTYTFYQRFAETDEFYASEISEPITITVGYLKGDVTHDGKVDSDDLTAYARHVARIEMLYDETNPDLTSLAVCDLDNDGDADADDLTLMARYVAHIIDSFD